MSGFERFSNFKAILLSAGAVLLIAALAFLAARRAAEPPTAGSSAEPTTESGAHDEETPEITPRLAKLLQAVYDLRGAESNPKIRKWLEWYGNKMIANGEKDEEIIRALIFNLWNMRKTKNPKELERFIEESRESELEDETESAGWKYNPEYSEKMNRIHKYRYEQFGYSLYRKGKTPRAVIEILVEGMDDLTAAKYLVDAVTQPEGSLFPEVKGESWSRSEKEYAAEYADRVLAKDPSSLDALRVKIYSDVDTIESARLLIEHHPDDEQAVLSAASQLYLNYPEETIDAISRILPEDGLHSRSKFHTLLGNAYERLDMLYEAADQFQKAFAAGSTMGGRWRYQMLEQGKRSFPSIWEERAAAAESAKQTPTAPSAPSHGRPHGAAPDEPHGAPPLPDHPDAPRPEGAPPPPSGAAMDMASAYADFAKAYQDAFEMEYGLSEATPEGYMNALLGMARAFAKAGDAQHAQDAYNAVRKRHSREEVQQVFRRFDEQERLKRQPPSDEENDDNGEED
ncbi:MAG: hypothetical protein OXT69_12790 [Candidatus Poribacteria bacterium]|nr:hypothetical protein [Candidatus Poribacteria bacterium]